MVEIPFFCLKGALYKVHWSILIKIKVHWSKMPLPYNRPLYSGLTSHKKNEVLLRLSRSRAMALHNILVFFLILKFLTFLILYFFQLEIMLGWIFRDWDRLDQFHNVNRKPFFGQFSSGLNSLYGHEISPELARNNPDANTHTRRKYTTRPRSY